MPDDLLPDHGPDTVLLRSVEDPGQPGLGAAHLGGQAGAACIDGGQVAGGGMQPEIVSSLDDAGGAQHRTGRAETEQADHNGGNVAAGQVAVDPHRIYIEGWSNGGFFALRAALAYTSVFAAAGEIEAVLDVPYSTKTPIRVFHIHGINDQVVPINGAPARCSRHRSAIP